ncbi:MAG: TolB-like 6-bladed beta-propeller domain-containing protein [Bacteroidales bacterium]|nr:TolB-like 6-bladed beta-propeller domain-containing protein [Bacteroidales bacterium]
MRKIYILLIIGILSFQCVKEKKQLELHSFQPLVYTSVPYPEILGITMQIAKKGNLVFLNDFRGDSLIHIYDMEKNQVLDKLIPVGNGPNELISPLEISFEDSDLIVLSRQTSDVYSIPLDSLSYGNEKMSLKFKVPLQSEHLLPLKDSLYLTTGYFEKRYALLDNKGNIINTFGEYPAYWSKEKDLSSRIKGMFHQSELAKHPQKDRFVSYSSHILEIYDYSTDVHQPALIKNILLSKYSYNFVDNGTMLSTDKKPDVERGITALATSPDCIYIVYNPNKDQNLKEDFQIQIIDWDGNPLKAFKLDKKITCLTIDEKENKAYAIIEDPDDSLITFDL